MLKTIKVLIIDDSAIVREVLEKGLSQDPQIEVVGKAADVYIARDKIVFQKPDVLTLDIEMPRMDGIEFLKRLMPQYPLPVVIVSAMAAPGAKATLDALENGALDYVCKPSAHGGSKLLDMVDQLIAKIKMAACTDVSGWKKKLVYQNQSLPAKQRILVGTTDKVIAIGASTGGTVALHQIIESFPSDMPGAVIVQHMPPVFTKLFADRLNINSKVEVKEASDGDRIVTGRVLIAPGGNHMEVVRSGGLYLVHCKNGQEVNGHCPSVDVLFDSVAKNVGPNAIGCILTGMGKDGASGMLAMRQAGAKTIAQDEESCVVFGMPNEAYKCGGAERLVHLDSISKELIRLVNQWERL